MRFGDYGLERCNKHFVIFAGGDVALDGEIGRFLCRNRRGLRLRGEYLRGNNRC